MLPFLLIGAAVAAVAAVVSSSSDSSSSSSSGSSRDYDGEAAEKSRQAKLKADKEAAQIQLKGFLEGHGVKLAASKLSGLVDAMASQPAAKPGDSLKNSFLKADAMSELDAEIKALEEEIAERTKARKFLDGLPIG